MDSSELIAAVTQAVIRKLQQEGGPALTPASKVIPLGVSNRHVHLAREDMQVLFGNDRLTMFKDLFQPGQFACQERLLMAGPKGAIEQVRVLGPLRSRTQIELAQSDCAKLGIQAPVRDSGDLAGSGSLTLVGPAGTVILREGAIIAARHIHMHTNEAALLGVRDGQRVGVRTGGPRGLIFNDVLVRVGEKFSLEMHVDIDEANAAGLKNGDAVELVTVKC